MAPWINLTKGLDIFLGVNLEFSNPIELIGLLGIMRDFRALGEGR